jgi:HAD superfamily hydrolase (TIGR01490 family)
MNQKTLVLFDFDGTLTTHETVNVFYRSLYNNKALFYYVHYICCLPMLFTNFIGIQNYLKLKRERLKIHSTMFSKSEWEQAVNKFVNKTIYSIIKREGLERIKWHKAKGHDVFVVSASYDFLLEKWCSENGIQLICNTTKRINNHIEMRKEDCNYLEKVTRIKQEILIESYSEVYAYGDSKGDLEMMKLATHKYYRVFKN